MSFKHYYFLLCIFIPTFLQAQENEEFRLTTDDLYAGEAIETFDLRDRSAEGDIFFGKDWMPGRFVFEDGSLSKKVYELNYNLLKQELIIQYEKKAYRVPVKEIVGFVLTTKTDEGKPKTNDVTFIFKNADKKAERTIYEQKVSGRYALLTQHFIKVIKPNYVPALDAGEMKTKYIKKQKHFLLFEGKLMEIPNRKKKAIKFFQQFPEAKSYIKENGMEVNNDQFLIDLIASMNK